MIIILFEDVSENDVGRNKELSVPAPVEANHSKQHRSAISWLSDVARQLRKVFFKENSSSDDEKITNEDIPSSLEERQAFALTELNG